MSWEIKKIPDDEYFATGDITKEMSPLDANEKLVVSNSFLKNVRRFNLFHILTEGHPPIDEELQAIFDTGSAFHCYILEYTEFHKRYFVSNTPDPTEERTRIDEKTLEWIEVVAGAVSRKYPNMTDGKFTEIAIFGEIDGVKVKLKLDKLIVKYDKHRRYSHIEIVDLKSIWFDHFKMRRDPNGERRKLRYMLSDVDYDMQAYFYTRLVEGWAHSIGAHCPIEFSLLTASKESSTVQKFRIGSEMMETGRLKFESVWGDVRDFVLHGKDRLLKEEVL